MGAAVIALLAAACALAVATPAHGQTLPPDFQQTTAFSGLTNPMAIEFASDGRVFVAEKSGLVKVFDGLSDTSPTTYADLRTDVHNFWDRGLLGLALDPNYPATPHVYVLYAYDKDPFSTTTPRWGSPGATSDPCPTPPGPTSDGCVVSGRLVRLVGAGNVSTSRTTLVEDWCQQYPSHSLGGLAFGADGRLYLSAGDGASFTFTDYGQDGSPANPCGDPPVPRGGSQTPPTAEGGALRSQDLRTTGDPTGLDGSILRLDPATGAAAPGNPLSSSSSANARRIIATGLRNPFRLTIRPGTNEVWVGDVGWSEWEEINRITSGPGGEGRNFGWPCYEGPGRQSGYDSANLNLCENLYSDNGSQTDLAGGSATPPYYTYSHASKVVPGESCPSGGSSISGMDFYDGNSFPSSYDDALFFADYSRDCIWAMRAGSNGLPDTTQRSTFVAGAANPVDIKIGPDGALYYADFDGGTIKRVHFVTANQGPTAVAQADPTSGAPPLEVDFDGTGSNDPDPGQTATLSYAWDLDGDGQFDDSTAAQPTHTYNQAGTYQARLRVTDTGGLSDTDTITIEVDDNTPPTPAIWTPGSTRTFEVGERVEFWGGASDVEDGLLSPSGFTWRLIQHHCPSNCHTHEIQTFDSGDSWFFNAPDHEYPSHLELEMTATDSDGASATTSVELQPRTVSLSFATAPTGLQLVLNSQTRTAPFSATVIEGSQNSISAPTPQTLSGSTYDWLSWSDGGARTHNITADSSATYTATYSNQPPGTNLAPTARASADPTSGAPPLQVDFDGSASSDPNPGETATLTYAWDLDGDGQFDDSSAQSPSHTYQQPGTYQARLRVTDARGLSDTDEVTIEVEESTPPAPEIWTPTSSTTWEVGQRIDFWGGATDVEDGILPPSGFKWRLIKHQCATTCPQVVQTFDGSTPWSFDAPDLQHPAHLELELEATDSDGASATTSVMLQPRTVQLSFGTTPTGLQLTFNSQPRTTPFTQTAIEGSRNTISAPTPQTLSGTSYDWLTWSDGGARTHDITADSNASYSATFGNSTPGANNPPIAAASADPTSGAPPLQVDFDGSASSDPDPGETATLTYAWDLDGDGQFDDSSAQSPSHTYQQPGTYQARLRVTDARGLSDTDTVPITVESNTPPNPQIWTPSSTRTFEVGERVEFWGGASDAEDGNLSPQGFNWRLIQHHCPSNCHTHVVQTFGSGDPWFFNAPDHEYPSHLELELEVTDTAGATARTSVMLQPRTVQLSFASSPSGLQLTLNSQTRTTPFAATVIEGSENSISAPTPQTLGGNSYDWVSWSDGGARTHNITANSSATYTAAFSGVAMTATAPGTTAESELNLDLSAGAVQDPRRLTVEASCPEEPCSAVGEARLLGVEFESGPPTVLEDGESASLRLRATKRRKLDRLMRRLRSDRLGVPPIATVAVTADQANGDAQALEMVGVKLAPNRRG